MPHQEGGTPQPRQGRTAAARTARIDNSVALTTPGLIATPASSKSANQLQQIAQIAGAGSQLFGQFAAERKAQTDAEKRKQRIEDEGLAFRAVAPWIAETREQIKTREITIPDGSSIQEFGPELVKRGLPSGGSEAFNNKWFDSAITSISTELANQEIAIKTEEAQELAINSAASLVGTSEQAKYDETAKMLTDSTPLNRREVDEALSKEMMIFAVQFERQDLFDFAAANMPKGMDSYVGKEQDKLTQRIERSNDERISDISGGFAVQMGRATGLGTPDGEPETSFDTVREYIEDQDITAEQKSSYFVSINIAEDAQQKNAEGVSKSRQEELRRRTRDSVAFKIINGDLEGAEATAWGGFVVGAYGGEELKNVLAPIKAAKKKAGEETIDRASAQLEVDIRRNATGEAQIVDGVISFTGDMRRYYETGARIEAGEAPQLGSIVVELPNGDILEINDEERSKAADRGFNQFLRDSVPPQEQFAWEVDWYSNTGHTNTTWLGQQNHYSKLVDNFITSADKDRDALDRVLDLSVRLNAIGSDFMNRHLTNDRSKVLINSTISESKLLGIDIRTAASNVIAFNDPTKAKIPVTIMTSDDVEEFAFDNVTVEDIGIEDVQNNNWAVDWFRSVTNTYIKHGRSQEEAMVIAAVHISQNGAVINGRLVDISGQNVPRSQLPELGDIIIDWHMRLDSFQELFDGDESGAVFAPAYGTQRWGIHFLVQRDGSVKNSVNLTPYDIRTLSNIMVEAKLNLAEFEDAEALRDDVENVSFFEAIGKAFGNTARTLNPTGLPQDKPKRKKFVIEDEFKPTSRYALTKKDLSALEKSGPDAVAIAGFIIEQFDAKNAKRIREEELEAQREGTRHLLRALGN